MKPMTTLLSAAGIAAAMALAPNAASAVDCKPSKWGAADTIGAANYVNPARVLAATKLVKKGESHPLGIVVEPGMPAFPPRTISLQVVAPGQHNGRELEQENTEPQEDEGERPRDEALNEKARPHGRQKHASEDDKRVPAEGRQFGVVFDDSKERC